MAMNNGWPPQAYTKETLAEAFEWLKSQPDNVRALAKDSSTLVSLYRNFQMRNREGFASSFAEEETAPKGASNSAPVSGEVFKAELKNLAQGLEEFSPSPTVNSITNSTRVQQPMNTAPSSPAREPQLSEQATGNPTLPPHVTRHRWEEIPSQVGSGSAVSASNGAQGGATTQQGLAALLDATSQERINQVRSQMNLSSNDEALRMLISLGFDRLKGILPVD